MRRHHDTPTEEFADSIAAAVRAAMIADGVEVEEETVRRESEELTALVGLALASDAEVGGNPDRRRLAEEVLMESGRYSVAREFILLGHDRRRVEEGRASG